MILRYTIEGEIELEGRGETDCEEEMKALRSLDLKTLIDLSYVSCLILEEVESDA